MTMHCNSAKWAIAAIQRHSIADCRLQPTLHSETALHGCRIESKAMPILLIFLSQLGSCQRLILPVVLEQVEVRGVEGELKEVAQKCITIRPNFSYSLQEVKEDTNRVFSSGYFERLEPTTEDTRDGVKLIFNVRPMVPLPGLSSKLFAFVRSPVICVRDSPEVCCIQLLSHR